MIPIAEGTATSVEDVLITDKLSQRRARRPDFAAENAALVELAAGLASSPAGVLQKLVDTAMRLCQAGSAGVSLLEEGDEASVFRWKAVAGAFAKYLGGTLPRDFSPCGTVLDRNAPQLMSNPMRFFPYIGDLDSPVREVLLVPFYEGSTPIGTVWIVAHDEATHFDQEDLRIVTSLTKFAGVANSIFRRIEATEKLEQAKLIREEQLRALAAATSDVIYQMNADWTEMHPLDGRGLVRTNHQPIRNWMHRNIPEHEHPRLREAIREAIANKKMFELEHQVIRPDNSMGWTLSRAAPLLDSDGNVTEWLSAASDITRRKNAEEKLHDIRARMETALSVSAIGTFSWDIQQDRFYADASVAKLFGVKPEIVEGESLSHLMGAIHSDDRDRVASQVAAAVENFSRYECDYRVVQADGSWRWVSARGQVEKDQEGRAARFPGVIIDITDRKNAESELIRVTSELERRTRLYEAILSSTPDFVYVFSLDHKVLYANEALTTMWGQGSEKVIGRTFLEIGYEAWHAEMHCREIDEVRATKQPIRGEVPFNGTHGRRIYDYIFVPVFGADGEVEAVAGTTRDVTERKSMEDELRDADRKKDDFIALLAHELRNPLAPIRNGLQVMRLAGGDVSAISNARAIMERQLAHMVRLIDDLLDVSRISRNKMELRRSRVLFADIVQSAVEAVKPLVEAANHRLTVDLPSGPIFLHGDLTRLAQVFGNLLSNSVKYTPAGGEIHFSAERRQSELVVAIRDNGIGIPADCLSSVFDMFTQVDRSIERNSGGLGIGLALVKGLVEMHEGTVTAVSEGEGRGSTFIVRLPTDSEAANSRDTQLTVPNRSKRRILVVDDNRDGANSLAMMLRLLGDEVRCAYDGVEGVEIAAEFRPEVILMDIGMPRLNGLEATRQIKDTPWGKSIMVIALTGWGQVDDRERSLLAGCDDHLVKPVDMGLLEKKLGKVRVR